jgi:hypothetical protein
MDAWRDSSDSGILFVSFEDSIGWVDVRVKQEKERRRRKKREK